MLYHIDMITHGTAFVEPVVSSGGDKLKHADRIPQTDRARLEPVLPAWQTEMLTIMLFLLPFPMVIKDEHLVEGLFSTSQKEASSWPLLAPFQYITDKHCSSFFIPCMMGGKKQTLVTGTCKCGKLMATCHRQSACQPICHKCRSLMFTPTNPFWIS